MMEYSELDGKSAMGTGDAGITGNNFEILSAIFQI